jgi:predicted enzyme related to lactoylglutathione lyase
MDEKPAELRQVLHPVADVAAAVRFYEEVFGLKEKFIDGDRYAAMDADGPTLALVGADEDVTGGSVAAGLKVTNVATTVRAVTDAGGTLVMEPQQGPHEVRAVVRDPWGNLLVVYAPL